jgi:predicted ATPase
MFSVTLTNYRSFKNQTFDFDKFNVLIGENSSGKSSLIKFLLALKQTLQAPANREINLLFSGEYVDLGSYGESIYYHDQSLPLKFQFAFGQQYVEYFFLFMNAFQYRPNAKNNRLIEEYLDDNVIDSKSEVSYELTKDLNVHSTIKTRIKNSVLGELVVEYLVEDSKSSKTNLLEPRCNLKYLDYSSKTIFVIENVGFSKDGFLSIIDGSDMRIGCRTIFGLTEDGVHKFNKKELEDKIYDSNRLFQRVAFLLVIQNFLRLTIESIEYINPIHTSLERFAIRKDKRKFTTINDLDDVLSFFNAMDATKEQVFKKYVKILKRLGIADDLKIIGDERLPITELRVKVKDLMSNISDVGYGVSLQLPIILKALLADSMADGIRKIIIIEQPEVHLHPKLHSALVETLVELSKHTTYFIETHSEHVVRKLQVLVKKGRAGIKSENVTIHYLARKAKHSEVSTYKILPNGLFNKSFPTGFFDNSYLLSKQLL